MAKVTIIIEQCATQVSPECTKTFERKPQRGRPAKSCEPCRNYAKVDKPTMAKGSLDRTCPCGASFQVKPGRGRKAVKCDTCRAAGTVYRQNSDGDIEAIRAETLAEEQREKAEQAGKERAGRLCEMMEPLLRKSSRMLIIR